MPGGVTRQHIKSTVIKKPGPSPGFLICGKTVIINRMRTFTPEELGKYNGRDGLPVYIAYKNKVYDVTASWHWKGGDHWHLHRAGHDLTAEFAEAPHGEDLIKRYPVVGVMEGNNT
jgi:predicted heme/steroid binding protein